MIRLHYNTNNSGGYWWLEDEDWEALEAAGWEVEWFTSHPLSGWMGDDGNPKDPEGDAKRDAEFVANGARWLGTLAKGASKSFETPDAGIEEWARITKQDPWAEGCNCCGRPHSFHYDDAKGRTHYAEIEKRTSFGGWS